MFIDISTYVGHWPFRNLEHNTLEGLDALAQENGITHMVVANIEGFHFKDANRANLTLLKKLKAYTGKTVFLPLAIINPNYPEWERDARAMIEAGFLGFEITPLYHEYSFAPDNYYYDASYPLHRTAQVLALAEELDVPVRVCASFENYRARSNRDRPNNPGAEDFYAMLSANKNAHVFVTSFHPGALGTQLGNLVRGRKNTYFDITAMAPGSLHSNGAKNAMKALDADQLCYGSLAPFQYLEPTLITLEYEEAIDTEAAKIAPARAFKTLR